MIKVGLTGGIGSGKTTVASFFEKQLAVPVFYSDLEAKKIMHHSPKARKELINLLGERVFNSDGTINKTWLSQRIFESEQADEYRLKVNEIIHPLVGEAFQSFCSKYSKRSYIIKESALLFETGIYKELDISLLVFSDIKDRETRIMQRDGLKLEAVRSKINKQWSEDKKKALADYIIYNSNNEFIIPQIIDFSFYLKERFEIL